MKGVPAPHFGNGENDVTFCSRLGEASIPWRRSDLETGWPTMLTCIDMETTTAATCNARRESSSVLDGNPFSSRKMKRQNAGFLKQLNATLTWIEQQGDEDNINQQLTISFLSCDLRFLSSDSTVERWKPKKNH